MPAGRILYNVDAYVQMFSIIRRLVDGRRLSTSITSKCYEKMEHWYALVFEEICSISQEGLSVELFDIFVLFHSGRYFKAVSSLRLLNVTWKIVFYTVMYYEEELRFYSENWYALVKKFYFVVLTISFVVFVRLLRLKTNFSLLKRYTFLIFSSGLSKDQDQKKDIIVKVMKRGNWCFLFFSPRCSVCFAVFPIL